MAHGKPLKSISSYRNGFFLLLRTSAWHHEPTTNIPVFLKYVVNQFLGFIQLLLLKTKAQTPGAGKAQ